MLERKTTHVSEMLGRLAQQFKGKPLIEGFIRILAKYVQELEDVFDAVYVKLAKPDAEGRQLELVGKLVGEPRGSRADPEFGEAIDSRVVLNTAHGRIEELIYLTQTLVGPLQVVVTESAPAGFELVIAESVTQIPALWQPSTPYRLGEQVTSHGKAYVAMNDGASGTGDGPSGTGAGIVDGSMFWNYYQPGTGESAALFALAAKPAGVRGIVWYHDTKEPFGFDGNPDAFGFGTGALGGAVELL